MSDTTVDLSVSASATPGQSFIATVTVSGTKPDAKLTIRLEQERGGGAPPAVFEQTPVSDDGGGAVGVFPVKADGDSAFLLTATARQEGAPLGGSVKKVGGPAPKKVDIVLVKRVGVGQPLDATVLVDGATPRTQVTMVLHAERGTVSLPTSQIATAQDNGRAIADFTVVYGTAGASLVSAAARDDRGPLGSDVEVVEVF